MCLRGVGFDFVTLWTEPAVSSCLQSFCEANQLLPVALHWTNRYEIGIDLFIKLSAKKLSILSQNVKLFDTLLFDVWLIIFYIFHSFEKHSLLHCNIQNVLREHKRFQTTRLFFTFISWNSLWLDPYTTAVLSIVTQILVCSFKHLDPSFQLCS